MLNIETQKQMTWCQNAQQKLISIVWKTKATSMIMMARDVDDEDDDDEWLNEWTLKWKSSKWQQQKSTTAITINIDSKHQVKEKGCCLH